MKRPIVRIDEEKCDGCGLCLTACHEGAIGLVNGKARLLEDSHCDGLGACLAHCPQNAILIEERSADPFVDPHPEPAPVARPMALPAAHPVALPLAAPAAGHAGGGCPGSQARSLTPGAAAAPGPVGHSRGLTNWPIQVRLVSPQAPFLKGAHLLLAADCVTAAHPDFQGQLLQQRPLLMGCPKLDDPEATIEKLTAIFATAELASLQVAIMEVPCCRGFLRMVSEALLRSGRSFPVESLVIPISTK